MKQLPEKLSDCIILALKDEELCFNSPDYIIDMNIYHTPTRSGCIVCFAGAVMAQTLERKFKCTPKAETFGVHNANRLLALDTIRVGGLIVPLAMLDIPHPDTLRPWLDVTPYQVDRSEWRNDMGKIVELLQEHEL
jgi:hypothetical protein